MLVNVCCTYVHTCQSACSLVHCAGIFMSTANHKPYLSGVAHDVMGDKNALDAKEEDFHMDFVCLLLNNFLFM